jgi:hypothetical protein
MNLLPGKQANPELAALFTPLIDILQSEWGTRSSSPTSKTMMCILKCKNTLTFMKHNVSEDNKNAVYITAKRHETLVADLKKCFFRKPKGEMIHALALYQAILGGLLEWYAPVPI